MFGTILQGVSVGVAGASGQVGRQVVELLVATKSVGVVVAMSRQRPASQAHRGLIHRCIDYSDEASLRAAFSGLDTLVFPGSDGDPKEMLHHHRNVLAAASWCNLRRMIYLSALDIDPDSRFPYAKVHQATEDLLRASGLEVCVLRASIFSEFFISAFVHPALAEGSLRLPAPSGRVSFVSKSDVAASIAGVVLTPQNGNGCFFNITGPVALSLDDVVRQVSDATSQNLRYEPMSETSYIDELTRHGIEPWYVEAFTTMLSGSIPRGNFQLVSQDVSRLTQHQPRAFRDCVLPCLNECNEHS